MNLGAKILIYTGVLLATLFFLFIGLIMAQPFLVPVVTAAVLAFLMLPLSKALENKGWNKILASLTSTLTVLIAIAGVLLVLFFQVRNFTDDWEEMQQQLQKRAEGIATFLVENTPLEIDDLDSFHPAGQQDNQQQDGQQQDEQKQDTRENESDEGGSQQGMGGMAQQAMQVAAAVMGFLGNFLLTFVYIFLFIHFRSRFREFILRFFPDEKRDEVAGIIKRSVTISRSYLAGRLILMGILAVFYSAGLAISGLENAILIGILSAVLSIIPIAGNFVGYGIAIAVALLTDGETGVLIGVTLTFIIAQFVETYILQPVILGDKVDIHPIFIIMVVVLGNYVWGVMGMVLAIPVLGMFTVVCRHIPVLNPLGYLLSKGELNKPGEKTGPGE
jgi:predicted PurR-regulated permease PerM